MCALASGGPLAKSPLRTPELNADHMAGPMDAAGLPSGLHVSCAGSSTSRKRGSPQASTSDDGLDVSGSWSSGCSKRSVVMALLARRMARSRACMSASYPSPVPPSPPLAGERAPERPGLDVEAGHGTGKLAIHGPDLERVPGQPERVIRHGELLPAAPRGGQDRKSTRLNSSHSQ